MRKAIVLVVVIGILFVLTAFLLLVLTISYNRHRKLSERITSIRAYSLLNAGLGRAAYKMKQGNYTNETFSFPPASSTLNITISPNTPQSTHIVSITTLQGASVANLTASFNGTQLDDYSIRREY